MRQRKHRGRRAPRELPRPLGDSGIGYDAVGYDTSTVMRVGAPVCVARVVAKDVGLFGGVERGWNGEA